MKNIKGASINFSLLLRLITFIWLLIMAPSMAIASTPGILPRHQIYNTATPESRVVGQISDFCSGTLISAYEVLTAGHCIYDVDIKKYSENMTFSPGQTGDLKPFGSFKVVSYAVHPKYVARGAREHDIGILVLEKPAGMMSVGQQGKQQLLGWLALDLDLARMEPFTAAPGGWKNQGTIQGYPGDKWKGTSWMVSCYFYILNQAPYLPLYNCDTFGGMSGSALTYGDGKGGQLIFGVHTNGHGSFNSGVTLKGNVDFLKANLIYYKQGYGR